MLSKIVPLEEMHFIISKFHAQGWPFFYKLVIELLRALSGCLLMSEDESEFLIQLSEDNCREVGLKWPSIIGRAG